MILARGIDSGTYFRVACESRHSKQYGAEPVDHHHDFDGRFEGLRRIQQTAGLDRTA